MMNYRINNQVHSGAFYHYPDKSLPLSARTYIDGCSYEYQEVDIETKLSHFGYLAIRNKHFYRELKDNIDKKSKDPQYDGYEDTAKHAMADYISYLRCGDTYDSLSFVYADMSFRQLYLLLVRELKLRYYEYEDFTAHVKCYAFKDYRFDNESIAERFKDDRIGLQAYLTSDQETRRLIKEGK